MTTVTAYVDADGDLVTIDTAERIRRATRDEREESDWAEKHEGGSGAIAARVADRTLRQRCPRYLAAQVWRGQ